MGNSCCRQLPHDQRDSICQVTLQQQKQPLRPQDLAEISRKFASYRTQTTHLPIPNHKVDENIKKFSKQYENEGKIWKVRQPYNLVYVNHDPEFENQPPRGHVTIYKMRDSGDVNGFYEGKIDDQFQPDLNESVYVYHNGSYFVGTGTNTGVFTNENTNLKYEGEWKEQNPHGHGREVNNRGTYEGEYVNGEKHGFGKFTWNNGGTYQGYFEKGALEGKGTYNYPENNYFYSGQYCQDLKHGKGVEKKQTQIYQGQFYKDKRCGAGVLTVYKDENKEEIVSTYDGMFEENRPNGQGTYTDHSTGKTIRGFWDQGVLISLL